MDMYHSASQQHDLFQSTPRHCDPANPPNTKSTTRQHDPGELTQQKRADDPATSQCERDKPTECRSDGSNFGSIPQTEQPE